MTATIHDHWPLQEKTCQAILSYIRRPLYKKAHPQRPQSLTPITLWSEMSREPPCTARLYQKSHGDCYLHVTSGWLDYTHFMPVSAPVSRKPAGSRDYMQTCPCCLQRRCVRAQAPVYFGGNNVFALAKLGAGPLHPGS